MLTKVLTLFTVFDPTQKMTYLKKYWGKDLASKALKQAEDIVRQDLRNLINTNSNMSPAV